MPRIRNWKDRTFYRPSAGARYRHIDALFDQGGRNVIDWRLIEAHWKDLMRISPYLTDHIMRFGTYATTELTVRPDAFDPHLEVDFEEEEPEPAAA